MYLHFSFGRVGSKILILLQNKSNVFLPNKCSNNKYLSSVPTLIYWTNEMEKSYLGDFDIFFLKFPCGLFEDVLILVQQILQYVIINEYTC